VLSGGTWVVSDRFDLSTFAYQGHGRGIDLDWIDRVNHYVTSGLTPDLYLVLDLPVREGIGRLERQDRPLDRIESETPGFLRKVRRGYVELAGSVEHAELVPASGGPAEVEARIRDTVTRYFPDDFAVAGSGGNTRAAAGSERGPKET
jgi:dTMP kinase